MSKHGTLTKHEYKPSENYVKAASFTSHLVSVSRGYILSVRFVAGSSIRIPSNPIYIIM